MKKEATSITDEFKDYNNKFSLNKFERELFHEEDDIVEKVIHVSYSGSPKKGDKWKIYENNKLTLVLDGDKFTKKEKAYMRTVDGFNLILMHAKLGDINTFKIKTEIKQILKG